MDKSKKDNAVQDRDREREKKDENTELKRIWLNKKIWTQLKWALFDLISLHEWLIHVYYVFDYFVVLFFLALF